MKQATLFLNGDKINEICVADNFWTRFKGLMGKKDEEIKAMKGLWIKPCSQIHTFFMKTPIDVVYLNKEFRIVHIDESVPKGKCCKNIKGANSVVEFPDGYLSTIQIRENDILEVQLL